MPKNRALDPIDHKILALLQSDATLSMQEIGEAVGLSSNPCWRRIRRMEADGIIRGRVALVDPDALGLGSTVFVIVRTAQHGPKWLEAFSKGVRDIPEIVECHRLNGDIDYLLKIIVRDIAHYDRVYKTLITRVPDLSDVSSSFSMERLKYDTAIDTRTL